MRDVSKTNGWFRREEMLARLQSGEQFDCVIVGGGASGLGAAIDAAARGHRVALVEQADFAKGTSSRSTKLVHGGVRYLAQGDVGLVRSALRERGLMRRNAPHLVRAMPFVIPAYRWWEKPYYAVGLGVYDRLAGALSFGRSRQLSQSDTKSVLPTIETERLRGGICYYDGQFDDARLAINLAQTAAEQGAVIVNYCGCVGFEKTNDRISGARLRDSESGTEFVVRAKTIVNATGVFVDALRAQDEPGVAPLVAVSQGVHVVLPKEFLPGDHALMVPKTADGRVLFAIPWHDRVVVGTTDTPGLPASLEPRAKADEITFIMEHAQKYLAKDPAEKDILSVFAGQRPLVQRGAAGSTAALSRDHTIAISRSGLITLTGGKWTTYRKMAEDVINQVEKVGGLTPRQSPTAELAIHGAASESLEGARALHFYGADARGIIALTQENAQLAQRVDVRLSLTGAEVIWHARHEMARSVEDVLARRTRSLLLDAQASISAAPVVARLLASELNRDEAWITRQVNAYTELASGWLLAAVQRSA